MINDKMKSDTLLRGGIIPEIINGDYVKGSFTSLICDVKETKPKDFNQLDVQYTCGLLNPSNRIKTLEKANICKLYELGRETWKDEFANIRMTLLEHSKGVKGQFMVEQMQY